MSINLETVGKVISVVAAVGGAVVAVISQKQLKETADLIGESVEGLKDLTKDDIQDEVIEAAIRSAAEEKVAIIAGHVYETVKSETLLRTRGKVQEMTETLYASISDEVTKQIASEVAKIDQVKLKKDVEAKAKAMIVSKFDGQLNDLLTEYNRNLENVGKIYQSIANKLDGTPAAAKPTITIN